MKQTCPTRSGTDLAITNEDSTDWYIPNGQSRWKWAVAMTSQDTDVPENELQFVVTSIPQQAYTPTTSIEAHVKVKSYDNLGWLGTGGDGAPLGRPGSYPLYFNRFETPSGYPGVGCGTGGGDQRGPYSWWGIGRHTQGSQEESMPYGVGGSCQGCEIMTDNPVNFTWADNNLEYYLADHINAFRTHVGDGAGGTICNNMNDRIRYNWVYRFWSIGLTY